MLHRGMGAQDQIVLAVDAGRERTGYLQSCLPGRGYLHSIGKIGEENQRIQEVIAVFPSSDDVQRQIDLRPGGFLQTIGIAQGSA
jgi:hypothetical protein